MSEDFSTTQSQTTALLSTTSQPLTVTVEPTLSKDLTNTQSLSTHSPTTSQQHASTQDASTTQPTAIHTTRRLLKVRTLPSSPVGVVDDLYSPPILCRMTCMVLEHNLSEKKIHCSFTDKAEC